jgi:hypothetical protein
LQGCEVRVHRLPHNRLIVKALERVVNDRSGWAPEFLHLRNADPVVAEAADRLVDADFGPIFERCAADPKKEAEG